VTRRSLRPLRTLLIGCWVAPLLFFSVAASQIWLLELQEARAGIEQRLLILREHALKLFETHELLLTAIDERVKGLSWDEIERSRELHELLVRINKQLGQGEAVQLADASGRERMSSRTFPIEPDLSVAERDYFVALRDTEVGTYIAGPSPGRRSGKMAVHVARRRSSADGRFDGVIAVVVRPEYFTASYQTIGMAANDFIAIFRDDGTILASRPLAASAARLSSSDGIFRERDGASGGILAVVSEADGARRLAGVRRLERYPVFIAYGVDYGQFVHQWLLNLRIYGVVALGSALILLLAARIAYDRACREILAVAKWREESERRQVAEEHSRQASKFEALGTMASGIAHTFNNLLLAMRGALEKSIGELSSREKTARRLGELLIEVERSGQLLRQVLAFSRCDAVRSEPVSLGEVVEATARLLRVNLPDHIRLNVVTGFRAVISGDFTQLEHVILNLASNAVHAIGHGPGTITLTTDRVEIDSDRGASLGVRPGAYARLQCADDGAGMTPEVLARLFDPFFTTKPPAEGTGLGMAMTFGIITGHGGAIRAESEPGRGARINIYLPLLGDLATCIDRDPAERSTKGAAHALAVG
jgi:signal transduction histidine kinase